MNILIGFLQILFGALSIAIGIAFIYICFKAYALLYDYSGKTYAYIFMFGIFGFVCNNRNDAPHNTDSPKEVFYVPEDSQNTYTPIKSVKKKIDAYGFNNYTLYVTFGKKENNKPVLLRSSISYSGFGNGNHNATYNLTASNNKDSTMYTIEYHGTVENYLTILGNAGVNSITAVNGSFTVNVDSLFNAHR
jgi:hypothetical protein